MKRHRQFHTEIQQQRVRVVCMYQLSKLLTIYAACRQLARPTRYKASFKYQASPSGNAQYRNVHPQFRGDSGSRRLRRDNVS